MVRARLPLLLLIALAGCRQEPAPEPAPAAGPAVAEAPAAPPPAAEPTEPPAGQVPRAFLCRGNEPFWSLDISADSALLKTPDAETALSGQLAATGTGAYTFRGAPEDEPEAAVEAMITPGQCFDTMADGPASPYSAIVRLDEGREGSGCCSVEFGLDLAGAPAFEAAGKPEAEWTRHLAELSDAIDRCTLDAGVATEAVTAAWPMNHGKATVRLRDAGRDRFDCLIDLETGEIESVAPAGEPTPSEQAGPLWLPARDTPPVLHCGRVERVMDVGDTVRGYLHYTDGCPAD
jgi:uncharacterized membrane protein